MSALSEVGVLGQQVDPLSGGDVHPDGRLLSVSEIQQAYRLLAQQRARAAAVPRQLEGRGGTRVSVPTTARYVPSAAVAEGRASATPPTAPPVAPHAPDTENPQVSGMPDTVAVDPEPTVGPVDSSPVEHVGAGWIAIAAAHSGAGASTIALALADAMQAGDTPVRLIETACASRSGLAGAARAELGLDSSGGWRRGVRGSATIWRRAANTAPACWPDGSEQTVLLDVGLATTEHVRRLVDDGALLLLACRVSVPGVRAVEALLEADPDARAVVTAVGPRRWPGAVVATCGPRLRRLRDAGRVVTVPVDRDLEVTGPGSADLPAAIAAAMRQAASLLTTTEVTDAPTGARRRRLRGLFG